MTDRRKPRMAWDGLYWRLRHRLGNRWMDARALFAGYCNHCPWTVPGEGGGYSFWRCGKRRDHDGMHRSRNYVWTDDCRTDYLPVDGTSAEWADQPWNRHPVLTLRQQRAMNRWYVDRAATRSGSR